MTKPRKFPPLLVLAFSMATGLSEAERHEEKPSWRVSKRVNKFANPKLFNDRHLANSHIRAITTTYPNAAISKAVHRAGKPGVSHAGQKGNIASTGYPYWTLSKRVHRER